MSAAANSQTEPQTEPQGPDNGQQVDWEAKYRESVAQSRKWEERAKASYKDSEELKQLKESKTESDKRIAELEKELGGYKAAKQQAEWKAEISKKTGVPSELLRGITKEEIQAHAELLEPLLHPAPKLPKVNDPARQPTGKTADEAARETVRRLFGTNN